MKNILVCDDDKEINLAVKIYLEKEKYNVLTAYDGAEALKIAKNNTLDLILMDVMMPNLDGIEALIEIKKDENIPIILLTCKSEDEDVVEGLNVGADDYITKPFNPKILIARVKSNIRKYEKSSNIVKVDEIQVRDLYINDKTKEVKLLEKDIKLTATEFKILKLLCENKGKVYSIAEIYKNIWDEDINVYGSENIVAVHVRHIREKLEIDPKNPEYLKVVWGLGYKVE